MPLLTPSAPPSLNKYSLSFIRKTVASENKDEDVVAETAVPPDLEQAESASSTVSRLNLAMDNISAEIAAELSAALIGHVLFLKSQVPFPVMQLYRIPAKNSNPRALKLRTELLASFDTLSSHLMTTFVALSTAFARTNNLDPKSTRRAYLAVMVGPSIGSAKTKVLLAVDGLVTKVWGERDHDTVSGGEADASSSDDEDDADEESSDESDSEETESSTHDSDDDASSPPPSRSPSPSPPSSSPVPVQDHHSSSQKPSVPSYETTHQTLRTVSRLLSHNMATAEHSMSAELPPSQTHVLIRAPRRFVHPAWIPRQNFTTMLDGVLQEFREEAGDIVPDSAIKSTNRKSRSKSQKMEGVWVACHNPGVEFGGDAAEEDEMIWWSWDGKIVGFSDW